MKEPFEHVVMFLVISRPLLLETVSLTGSFLRDKSKMGLFGLSRMFLPLVLCASGAKTAISMAYGILKRGRVITIANGIGISVGLLYLFTIRHYAS